MKYNTKQLSPFDYINNSYKKQNFQSVCMFKHKSPFLATYKFLRSNDFQHNTEAYLKQVAENVWEPWKS
jgi:hypothetical protein